MGHSGVNTRYIGDRAALAKAGDANHLEETLILRMDHLQRTAGITLAGVFSPATVRITGTDHTWRDTIRNFRRSVMPYRAHYIINQIQLGLLQPISLFSS